MNIIILADKFQKRMKSKGCVGLFNVGNDYLIIRQYKTLKKIFPDANIVYVYGFEHKKLLTTLNQYSTITNNITLIYNPDYELYNYGASLQLVKEYINDDTIILFGETIVDKNLFLQFNLSETKSQIILNKNANSKLGCIINNSKIENIFYDLENKIEEIYFISKNDAQILNKVLSGNTLSIKNMFIFELINKLIDMNIDIRPLVYSTKYRITKLKRKNAI